MADDVSTRVVFFLLQRVYLWQHLCLFCSFFVWSGVFAVTLFIASMAFCWSLSELMTTNPFPLSYGVAVRFWRFLNDERPFRS